MARSRKNSLDTKYWFMFWSYHCVNENLDNVTKQMIVNARLELRGDAAYFLLVNFDQMLYRVEGPSFPLSDWPPVPAATTASERYNSETLPNIFEIIMHGLESQTQDEYGYSAHQVMKSIDGGWVDITQYALWE